jgi:endonuclease YncB( thermonuclease family)
MVYRIKRYLLYMDVNRYKNARDFTFDGKTLDAFVLRVYDGDTITASIDVAGTCYSFHVRILGIDTSEIHGKTEVEKQRAQAAKTFVSDRILEKFVTLKCGHFDKYGRILSEVIYDSESIGDLLLHHELAVKYDGGKK